MYPCIASYCITCFELIGIGFLLPNCLIYINHCFNVDPVYHYVLFFLEKRLFRPVSFQKSKIITITKLLYTT